MRVAEEKRWVEEIVESWLPKLGRKALLRLAGKVLQAAVPFGHGENLIVMDEKIWTVISTEKNYRHKSGDLDVTVKLRLRGDGT